MSKRLTAYSVVIVFSMLFFLLLWLCVLMSTSSTLRSFTEPFAGNRRHNIGTFNLSLPKRTLYANILESDIDKLEQQIRIKELRLSSTFRSILKDVFLVRYPQGIYEIEFIDMQLPKSLIEATELQGLSEQEPSDTILLTGKVSVLVLPTKLLRLERIHYLLQHKQDVNISLEAQKALVKKINLYLPKTIF